MSELTVDERYKIRRQNLMTDVMIDQWKSFTHTQKRIVRELIENEEWHWVYGGNGWISTKYMAKCINRTFKQTQVALRGLVDMNVMKVAAMWSEDGELKGRGYFFNNQWNQFIA